jgi:flagellar biosynthesis protein FlhF
MKIKKVTASDTRLALEEVRRVLGDEAIILHVQEKGDGRKKKKYVEVTAALDEDYEKNKRIADQLFTSRTRDPGGNASRINMLLGNPAKEDRPKFRGGRENIISFSDSDSPAYSSSSELDDVRNQLESLTELLRNNGYPEFSSALMEIYAHLVGKGMEKSLAAMLMRSVERKLPPRSARNKKSIKKAVLVALETLLSEYQFANGQNQEERRIRALIGPTGVGKTTCIAKLSAIDTVYNDLKVGLISTDTYRIGAIEQLRTYANITKLALEVVYNPDEMAPAIDRLSDCEVIYIDTPGRSQRNTSALIELTKFLKHCPDLEIVLVLSLTSNLDNLQETVSSYSILPIRKLLFTKYDETNSAGSMLSVLQQCKCPVSFISTGQNVPEDIQSVDSKAMANLIMGVKHK